MPRLAQAAAHPADHVIPPVPVRQWVISVPTRLRGMLADRPRAVAALTKIFLAEIERLLLVLPSISESSSPARSPSGTGFERASWGLDLLESETPLWRAQNGVPDRVERAGYLSHPSS
jgi:hypothetical protein